MTAILNYLIMSAVMLPMPLRIVAGLLVVVMTVWFALSPLLLERSKA